MTGLRRLPALVILSALLSAGCYESAFPLGPATAAALDPKVIGTWKCITADPSDDGVMLTIGRARDGVYAISMKEKDHDPDQLEAHASKVGGQALLNIRSLNTGKKPWVFGRYTLLRPGVFDLQIVSDKALKGVEVSPAAVGAAIERKTNDPALFDEEMITCVRARGSR